ncbi:MAG: hypothetical protein WKF75_18970, partial [Singulisphaera sp.]
MGRAAEQAPAAGVPEGWLVLPDDGADEILTAADVTARIDRGIAEANRVPRAGWHSAGTSAAAAFGKAIG